MHSPTALLKTVTTRLPEEHITQLEAMARRADRKLSTEVRIAVRFYLASLKEQAR